MAPDAPHPMIEKPVLFIATTASFITPFMVSSVTIALPSIGREFSMTAVMLGWVAAAYILAAAIFLVPFGKCADIYGRKKILLYGISLYTLSALVCGLAPSTPFLISGRVAQGIGASMIFGTSTAIVTSVFRAGERGRALGITTAATYLGLSLGPVLGGLLTQHLGWRSIFLVTVPLGFIEIVLIIWKLKEEWREAQGERFDTPGAILFGLALASFMYGFSKLPSQLGSWLIVAGALGIAAFVSLELRVENPLLHMDLFVKNRVFAFSNLAALINYSASFAVTFLMSLYLQYVKALTPQNAGIILVSQPLVMAAFSPFAGRLSDRIESRIVASLGMTLTAVALLFFVFLRGGTALIVIIMNLMLLGLGLALFSSPNTNAVMSSVAPRLYGVSAATLAAMRMTGQMLSMGIAMLIFAVHMGTVQMTAQSSEPFLTSLRIGFIVFSVLSFAGIFASLARGNVR